MNFTRNTSHFFRGKTIKSFCQNKYSCSFFNSTLNKFSSRSFVTFTNLFFLSSIQKLVLTSRSLGMQASSVVTGNSLQSVENPLESSSVCLEKLSGSTSNLNELILLAKSNFLSIIYLFYKKID